jgi:hypothetical protein
MRNDATQSAFDLILASNISFFGLAGAEPLDTSRARFIMPQSLMPGSQVEVPHESSAAL